MNLVGAGKVGRTFLTLLAQQPRYELGDVLGRRPDRVEPFLSELGQGKAVAGLDRMRPADLWLLSVQDDAISGVAQALARGTGRPASDKVSPPVAVHFSGFLASGILSPLQDRGWSVASCHPVLSFADPTLAVGQFPGTCCAVEGEVRAVARIGRLIADLGGRPFPVHPERKALYHAAAVFSNNFTTVLQAIAQEAWQAAGVPEEMARQLGHNLLAGTSESVSRLGPAAALTGPAARGDRTVLRLQQAEVAQWHPEAGALYRDLSLLARRLKRSGSTGQDMSEPDNPDSAR